jgi:hypothetical protein
MAYIINTTFYERLSDHGARFQDFSDFPSHRRRIPLLPQGEIGLRSTEVSEFLEVSVDGILNFGHVFLRLGRVGMLQVASTSQNEKNRRDITVMTRKNEILNV